MTDKYITELERGHIEGQAVTYFGLAIVLMGSISTELKLVMPSATSGTYLLPMPVALPYIDLGSWPILIIALVFLFLSIFFMASLFINSLVRLAMSISRA